VEVIWSRKAILDLDRICDALARFSESAAQELRDRVTARSWQLGRFPESGRIVPEFQTPLVRELIEGDYRIIFERFADRVEVIGVLHGRMTLDD
jgi:plasmid stabilization system protein ParE